MDKNYFLSGLNTNRPSNNCVKTGLKDLAKYLETLEMMTEAANSETGDYNINLMVSPAQVMCEILIDSYDNQAPLERSKKCTNN